MTAVMIARVMTAVIVHARLRLRPDAYGRRLPPADAGDGHPLEARTHDHDLTHLPGTGTCGHPAAGPARRLAPRATADHPRGAPRLGGRLDRHRRHRRRARPDRPVRR